MNLTLIYLTSAAGGFYLLWLLFLAVMNLKRVRDAGLLTTTALVLGAPVLLLGLVVDALVNWLVMTIILIELPQEATVTARLKRHNAAGAGWRKSIAAWFEPLLDPFDPSGDHI